MSGAHIRIDANTAEIDAALAGLLSFGDNPFDFLNEVGEKLVKSTQDRFDDGVGPDGKAWKVSQRAAREGGRTLVKSGALVDGINAQATNEYVDVGPDDDVYAAIHQFGGQAGRNQSATIPARPYLGISGEDESMIIDTAFTFIEQAAA